MLTEQKVILSADEFDHEALLGLVRKIGKKVLLIEDWFNEPHGWARRHNFGQ